MNKVEFIAKMKDEDLSPIIVSNYSFMQDNNVSLGTDIPYLGFDIIPGWIRIIKVILNAFETEYIENGNQITITQLKEKFGELRIYTNGTNSEMYNLIELAEEISRETCMKCGEPGTNSGEGYWITTYCDKCKAK